MASHLIRLYASCLVIALGFPPSPSLAEEPARLDLALLKGGHIYARPTMSLSLGSLFEINIDGVGTVQLTPTDLGERLAIQLTILLPERHAAPRVVMTSNSPILIQLGPPDDEATVSLEVTWRR